MTLGLGGIRGRRRALPLCGNCSSKYDIPRARRDRSHESLFDAVFCAEQFVRMKLGTAPLARHYNKMKQVPDLTVNAENCGAMTTILVRRRDTSPVRITPQSVYNEAYSHELVPQQAEGFVIEANGRRHGVVFLYQDVGNTEDYNGICGAYGLGRVMACDLNQASRQMIVLQW